MSKKQAKKPDATFKAVNWNLGNGQGVDADDLRPVATKQHQGGVRLFVLNEFSPGARRVWTSLGYVVFGYGSNAVAYHPSEWQRIKGPHTVPGRQLTKATWRRAGGAVVRGTMTGGTLRNRRTGHVLRVGALHTPAGVQHAGRPDRRETAKLRQLLGMMTALGRRVRRWVERVDGVLVGADDNADETRAPKAWRRFTGYRVNQLRQLQPPQATHGGGRRIDPFYMRGLDVRAQWVTPNPSDHHLHGGEFAFRGRPKRGGRRTRDMVETVGGGR